MDPLSAVLTLLQPEAAGTNELEAHGACAIRFPRRPDAVVFWQMLEGEAEVVRDDGQRFYVGQGDFVLMASPPSWVMSTGAGGPTVGLKAVLADPGLLLLPGKPRTSVKVIAGYFIFTSLGTDLLRRLMLPIVHVRGHDTGPARLGLLLQMLREEALAERAGRSHVLQQLLQLILVEALRQPGVGWQASAPGMMKGLGDRQIGRALHLIHSTPSAALTLPELARTAGMSRSAFAARFLSVIGMTPKGYLSAWRMTLARQALQAEDRPMGEIARLAGYQSVSAFSTAYRRRTGSPPSSHWGREASAQLEDARGTVLRAPLEKSG